MAGTHIQIRISEEDKAQTKKVLDKMGLTYSGAIKLFFEELVERGELPFRKTKTGDCEVNFEVHSIDKPARAGRFANLIER